MSAAVTPGGSLRLKGRYECKETLGRGGMGIVYRAYDNVLKCDVAVKTLNQTSDPKVIELFHRECEVLVALNHPNIVQILDLGEFEHEGQSRPYFVMPLLPGAPLSQLIHSSAPDFTIQRRVEVISQVCRGLHAAHERGLIHRDIKPANILVMPDYSAEIIDFGVAHMADTGATGIKGSLYYMAPELLEGKPPTPLSDIFALGVTAYELFTQRRPFERRTEGETIEAILHESPPPAAELNPEVNQAIGRVIHKCIAKQPWHRFRTARETGEHLEMAYRGQPIECFDPARIRPRLERAKAASEQGDHQFAAEILTELEAEGHADPEISILSRQVDFALRQKLIRQLLSAAQSRLGAQEYPLALQKVQEALTLESDNAEALALKSKIEGARAEGQIEGWFRLARQHIDNNAFTHAREALDNVLKTRPQDQRAQGLLAEITRREQEYLRAFREKEELYQRALEAWERGDVSSAMTRLEQLLEIEHRAPDHAHQERSNAYHNLYNQARSEHDRIRDLYSKARKHLDDRDFAAAMEICDQYLQQYPANVLFQSLKFDALEQQRLQLSAYVAEIDRRVEAETGLDRRVAIVDEAVRRFPGEPHFENMARIMRDRAGLVAAIVAKARYHEEQGQYNEALGQWEILRTIHTAYPGLQLEIDRLTKRRGQQIRMEGKARWIRQIESHVEAREHPAALEACRAALEELPEDAELLSLRQLAARAQESCAEVLRLASQGARSFDAGAYEEGLEDLRRASQADEHNAAIRSDLLSRLVARAQQLAESDRSAAEKVVQEALSLDPAHAGAKGVRVLLDDLKREAFLNDSIGRIRVLQVDGDLKSALTETVQALSVYPEEARLIQLRTTLESKTREAELAQRRHRDLERLRGLAVGAQFVFDPAGRESILEQMHAIAAAYRDERAFQSLVEEVETRLKAASTPPPPPAATATSMLGAAAGPIPQPIAAAPAPPVTSNAALTLPAPAKHSPTKRRSAMLLFAVPLLIGAGALTWTVFHHRWTQAPRRSESAAVRPPTIESPATKVPTPAVDQPAPPLKAEPSDAPTTPVPRRPAKPQSRPEPPAPAPIQPAPDTLPPPPNIEPAQPTPPAISPELQRQLLAPTPVRTMDVRDWDKELVNEGLWWVRKGGDFVLYRPTPTAGTFEFTLRPDKASGKVRWVLGYLDEKNYLLFEIDKNTYSSVRYADGKKIPSVTKKPHTVKKGMYTIRMVVAPDHLAVMLASDANQWSILDEWTRPDRPFNVGRFGLYFPGEIRMWLANFSFGPQPAR